MIIGISGNNGAGKDTFGMLLQAALERKGKKVKRIACADALYFVCSYLFHIPPKAHCDANPLLKRLPINGITVRDILIQVGTKMREIDPDVWVRIMLEKANEDFTIVTDIRFTNEMYQMERMFQVQRDGQDENVGFCWGTVVHNNGTMDDLQDQANKMADFLLQEGVEPEEGDIF